NRRRGAAPRCDAGRGRRTPDAGAGPGAGRDAPGRRGTRRGTLATRDAGASTAGEAGSSAGGVGSGDAGNPADLGHVSMDGTEHGPAVTFVIQ
ncbi:hypothetical protein ACWGIU_36160, partial [Streptomyces sp. NPDC054840]